MSDTLQDIIKLIDTLIKMDYTGSIEIHFNQGGICKVIKHEIVK